MFHIVFLLESLKVKKYLFIWNPKWYGLHVLGKMGSLYVNISVLRIHISMPRRITWVDHIPGNAPVNNCIGKMANTPMYANIVRNNSLRTLIHSFSHSQIMWLPVNSAILTSTLIWKQNADFQKTGRRQRHREAYYISSSQCAGTA